MMTFCSISKGPRLIYWPLYKIINVVKHISEKYTNKSYKRIIIIIVYINDIIQYINILIYFIKIIIVGKTEHSLHCRVLTTLYIHEE